MSEILTLEEVAKFFKIDILTLRRIIQRGDMTPFKVGGQYRFTQEDIQEYIQKSRVKQEEEVKA